MIILSFYPPGSHVQLTRVLAQIPEIHNSNKIWIFIIEIDNLEVLHDDSTTILSPFLQFRYKRIAGRHHFQTMPNFLILSIPILHRFPSKFRECICHTLSKFYEKKPFNFNFHYFHPGIAFRICASNSSMEIQWSGSFKYFSTSAQCSITCSKERPIG